MEDKPIKPKKVKVTLSITKEAQDVLLFRGHASDRTMGEFISRLIVEHDARVSHKPTRLELAAELRRLADLLEAEQ
jgi:hypothetical protein